MRRLRRRGTIAPRDQSEGEHISDLHVPGGPILVAEHDRGSAQSVAGALDRAGFLVLVAPTQRLAAEVARTRLLAGAVLDVILPDGSGYELCRALREAYGPTLPIVFVSGERVEPHDRVGGLLLGADDYLAKPFDHEELVVRLRRLLDRAAATTRSRDLTPREHEVLSLLAQGLDQREIAERLVIASKTVATHIERILAKLGVHSRAQAVALAYRDALVTP